MNQAQLDAHALQMWMFNSPFVVQPMMSYPPIQNPAMMSFMIGQSQAGSTAMENLSNPDNAIHSGGKKRKRKNKGTVQEKCESLVVSPSVKENSNEVIDKIDAISDAVGDPVKMEVTEELVNTDENILKNGLHPAFNTGKPLPTNRLQAVMKRNTCRLCGKLFRSGQLLRQHMLVHTDQRKYQCQYCDRTFKQLSHLQQHHRIHTGEKPYKCVIEGCGRSFPQLSNLQHHYRNHDKPEPPSDRVCIFCDRTYCSEVVLRNHVMKIHLSNKKDPLMTQLTKDIEDIEQMESISTDSSKDSLLNLASKAIDELDPTNNNSLNPLKSLSLNADINDPEEAELTNDTPTDLSNHIPLNQYDKDMSKIEQMQRFLTSLFDKTCSSDDKEMGLSLVNESGNNSVSKELESLNASNFVPLQSSSGVQQVPSSDSQEATEDTRFEKGEQDPVKMFNGINDAKESISEEPNENSVKTSDPGFMYNYTLDAVERNSEESRKTETDLSACLLDGNSNEEQSKLTTKLSNGNPTLQRHVSALPPAVSLENGEHERKTSISEETVLVRECISTCISNGENTKNRSGKDVAINITKENTAGARSSPNGGEQMSASPTSIGNSKDISEVSNHDFTVPLSAVGSMGRARKRKAFVPQRIMKAAYLI